MHIAQHFQVRSLVALESEKFHNLLQNLIISTNIRGSRQFRQSPLFSSNKIDTRHNSPIHDEHQTQ